MPAQLLLHQFRIPLKYDVAFVKDTAGTETIILSVQIKSVVKAPGFKLLTSFK